MDEWTQQLPPVAAERVRRQRESRVAGSLLSAPAAAALAAAGLQPAGEVMGCIVMHMGWSGFGCGGYGTYGGYGRSGYAYTSPVLSSGNQGLSWQGFGPYVRARYHAYDTVLARLLAETAALGADGVVGVTLTWSVLDTGARELIALGTAVRKRRPDRRAGGNTHPAGAGYRPYCTELSGEDVAKAVLSGWVPLGIAVGLSIAVKHDDWMMQQQTSWLNGAGNTEVDGLTELLHTARTEARQKLAERAGRLAGAAQIVVSRTDLRVHERACAQDQRDHIAEASFIGTALARDPHHGGPETEPQSSLSILPLGGPTRNYRGAAR